MSARTSSVQSMRTATLLERKVFHGKAEFGQDFFVRNAFAAVLLQPSIGAIKGLIFFFGQGFLIRRSGGNGARHWVHCDEFQKTHRRHDHGGMEPFDQRVSLLFAVREFHSFHASFLAFNMSRVVPSSGLPASAEPRSAPNSAVGVVIIKTFVLIPCLNTTSNSIFESTLNRDRTP
jgi:hypothetical protein